MTTNSLETQELAPVSKYSETRINLGSCAVYTRNEDKTGAVTYVQETDKESGGPLFETRLNLVEGSKGFKELYEAHTKLGLEPPTVLKHQTFEYSEITDPTQIVPYFTSLGLDPAVAAKKGADIFQRGWAIAQQVEIRNFMSDDNQPEIEGVASVAAEAATPGERRQKDPMVAAAANLKKAGFNISADDLKALMATMGGALPLGGTESAS